MTASLYNRADSGPDIEDFTISAQDYNKVLALFDGRKLDISPAKWQVLGYIAIEGTSSHPLRINLFRTGDDSGAFSIDGTYYRGTTDGAIIAVLNDCYKAFQERQGGRSNKSIKATGK
jgi:hypothetical protein